MRIFLIAQFVWLSTLLFLWFLLALNIVWIMFFKQFFFLLDCSFQQIFRRFERVSICWRLDRRQLSIWILEFLIWVIDQIHCYSFLQLFQSINAMIVVTQTQAVSHETWRSPML